MEISITETNNYKKEMTKVIYNIQNLFSTDNKGQCFSYSQSYNKTNHFRVV